MEFKGTKGKWFIDNEESHEMLEVLQSINSSFDIWDSLPCELQEQIYKLIKESTKDKNSLIPSDAHSLEVFAIKDCDESPTGKQAFIGFKISNGDFHFIQVPYTEPKQQEQ
jgi:hypothetical protein